MNDSSTGGYLVPLVTNPPDEDLELDRKLVRMVAGISGIETGLVRPRWQPTTPKQPEPAVTWCAVGITVQTPDDGPAMIHESAGDGTDTYQRHERIELLCTFYGPSAKGAAQQLADGISVPQNREALAVDDMAFVGAGEIRAVPELVNEIWIRRYDITLTLRRKVERTYPVLNLESADGSIAVDGSQSISLPLSVTQI